MLIMSDKSVEKSIRKVDPAVNLDKVLYVVIMNGVLNQERMKWTRRKKMLEWTVVLLLLLIVIFSESHYVKGLYIAMVGLSGATMAILNDYGYVVLDERGYRLYLLNKWQTKVISVIPLNLDEIVSATPLERAMRKRTVHLHLYVSDEYHQVMVNRSPLGLRKQKESFSQMVPDFIGKTADPGFSSGG